MISQLQLLNKIIDTKDFSSIITHNLTEDYFFNYKDEFKYIKNHYDQYKAVPDKLTFANMFPNFEFVAVTEPETYLLQQVTEDYTAKAIVETINTSRSSLENGKAVTVAKNFIDLAAKLQCSSSVLTSTDILSNTSRYDRYLERTSDRSKYYVSTGFPELDAILGGIDRENEDMTIAARTGQGKTFTMLKMAAEASKQGLTVGIFEGEMTTDKVGYRLDTLLGSVNNTAITRGDLYIQQEYKRYIESLAGVDYGPIKILTPNDVAGNVTVDTLRAFIEQDKLDILFVDQYSLLEDTSHARASFERVGNIAKAVKKLQVEYKIPIIAVSQMNRTKNEDGSQDTTQIGLSDMIGQFSTVILMLDRKDDNLIINIVKARDGGGNNKLTYNVDWNIGKFTYIPEEGDEVASDEDYDNIAASYEL